MIIIMIGIMIRMISMMRGGTCSTHQIFVRKPKWQSPLGRPWCTKKDDIKMDLQELEWESGD
jgi:hypothetical protein